VTAAAALELLRVELKVLARRRWVDGAALAGVVWIAIATVVAAGESGHARLDTLEVNAASLMLIGGLAVALCLGGGAFSRDASSGYLGLLVAAGATPSRIGFVRLAARVLVMIAVFVIWGVAMQIAAVAIGHGVDGSLAVHVTTWFLNGALVLCASAALASVIGPFAAGVFGFIVFFWAVSVVNIKADLDQGAISRSSGSFVNSVYGISPRAIVSPMLESLQRRGAAGPAAPDININGLTVTVPASRPIDVVWTLAWTLIFASLAVYGVRRRQL
jgi:hypothetical protein